MSSTEAEAEAEEEGADEKMCCAGCGKAEVDEIKLRKCTDCDLVRYCSDTCHREHRPKHNEIVRNEPLNYGMKFCFGSHKAAISVTVRFVVCHYRLIQKKLL